MATQRDVAAWLEVVRHQQRAAVPGPASRSTSSSPTPRTAAACTAPSALLDLTALGIGAVIGTGIFVILGEAIGDSGPAIILSFVLAGVTCVFSALSYAELASTIPVSGSAYTYGYATMGELVAWIIGWDLILEYGVSVAAVAVGWGGYLSVAAGLAVRHLACPTSIAGPPGDGGVVNLPAVFLVLAVAALLILGVRESARTNTVMVVIKLAVLLLFIGLGVHGGSTSRQPLARSRRTASPAWSTAASLIFFAYIGFDAISTVRRGGREPSTRPADRDHRRRC